MTSIHRPILKGTSYTCLDCGLFLRDVRTGSQLRRLRSSDWGSDKSIRIRLGAVERRYLSDPEFAKRLASEDLKEVVSQYKLADKFNDFLMNPQARPDLQKPEAQQFLQGLQSGGYVNSKTDELTPWLTREWKKGRIQPHPANPNLLRMQLGSDYDYETGTNTGVQGWHSLTPDQLNHWGDWYRSNHPSRKGVDIMQMQIPQLHQTIKDWDTDMREQAKGQAQIRGDIEHHYPDGWSVQRLTTPEQLEEEGEKMGHCVGGYADHVARGHSLIYSLRDHHNEPHATWEIEPYWEEGPDGHLHQRGTIQDPEYPTKLSPKAGRIVQIQGKGNEPPIEAYQKRIKDYFEHTIPDEEDRPGWDDQYITDIDDLNPEHGYTEYHPGDYGLGKANIQFDWENIVDALEPGAFSYSTPDDAAKYAAEHDQLDELDHAATTWAEDARQNHAMNFSDDFYSNPEYYAGDYPDREPLPEDFPEEDQENYPGELDHSAYEEAWYQWEKEKDQWLDEQLEEARDRDWEDSAMGGQAYEWEYAIANARQKQLDKRRNPSKYQSSWRLARKVSFHRHWSTGEPCNCTFTRHLKKVAAWSENAGPGKCETCGDPLDHGRCNRCDWGNWTNSPDLTKNPQDPVKDLKGPVQSSWRELTPSG